MSDAYIRRRISQILRIQACECRFPTCSLQHLPVELIVSILSELPVPDIVLCQGISGQFRDIVRESVTLQYKIACYEADVLEEPPDHSRDKRKQTKAIREWDEAWKSAKWKMELTDSCAAARGLSLKRPPSIIREASANTHTFHDLGDNEGYGYDEEMNVLIVARLTGGGLKIQLEVLDLTTREKHPRVEECADTMIMDLEEEEVILTYTDIFITRCSVMCYIGVDEEDAEYWWYDWTSGSLHMHVVSGPDVDDMPRIDDFTFLDERYLLLTVNRNMLSKTPLLAVFDREDVVGPWTRDNVDEILREATAFLELPVLEDDYYYDFVWVDCQPLRRELPENYKSSQFTPANISPVIHLNLIIDSRKIYGEPLCSYDLLIPSELVMQLIEDYGSTWKFEDWQASARIFEGTHRSKGAVSASRFVTREVDPASGMGMAVIYEFAPLQNMLRDLSRGRCTDVKLDSNTLRLSPDSEESVTEAPYRRIATNIMLSKNEEPHIAEDSIIVVDSTSTIWDKLYRKRVYCF